MIQKVDPNGGEAEAGIGVQQNLLLQAKSKLKCCRVIQKSKRSKQTWAEQKASPGTQRLRTWQARRQTDCRRTRRSTCRNMAGNTQATQQSRAETIHKQKSIWIKPDNMTETLHPHTRIQQQSVFRSSATQRSFLSTAGTFCGESLTSRQLIQQWISLQGLMKYFWIELNWPDKVGTPQISENRTQWFANLIKPYFIHDGT